MIHQLGKNSSISTSRIFRSTCPTSQPTFRHSNINMSFNQTFPSALWPSCNRESKINDSNHGHHSLTNDRIHIIPNVWRKQNEPMRKTDRKQLKSSQGSDNGEYKKKEDGFIGKQQNEGQQSKDNLNITHNNFYQYWKKKAIEYQEQNFRLNKQNSKLLEELEVFRFKKKHNQISSSIIFSPNEQRVNACSCDLKLKAYQSQISVLQKTLQLKQKQKKQQMQKIKWLSAHCLEKQNSELIKKPKFLSQCRSELEEKSMSNDSPFEKDALISVNVSNFCRSLNTGFPQHHNVRKLTIDSPNNELSD